MKKLRDQYIDNDRVRGLIHNEKEVLLILMDEEKNKLTEFIFEIMELLQAQPAAHIFTPAVDKLNLTIPDAVLDKVYEGLPDRRRR